jgi:hypothetical protein
VGIGRCGRVDTAHFEGGLEQLHPITHLVNTHWHFDHTDGNACACFTRYAARDGGAGRVGKFCRDREALVAERRQILDAAQTAVGLQADPQTDAAIRLAAWTLRGLVRPTGGDFEMLRLMLLALLPQITKGIPFAKPHRSSTGGVHSRLGCGGRSSTTARTSTNAWHSTAEQEVSPTMACQRSSPPCSTPSSFRSTRPILCLSSVSGSLTGKPVLRWKVGRCHSRNSRRVHQLLTAVRPASGRRSGGPMLNDGGLGSRRRFQQMANVPVRTG